MLSNLSHAEVLYLINTPNITSRKCKKYLPPIRLSPPNHMPSRSNLNAPLLQLKIILFIPPSSPIKKLAPLTNIMKKKDCKFSNNINPEEPSKWKTKRLCSIKWGEKQSAPKKREMILFKKMMVNLNNRKNSTATVLRMSSNLEQPTGDTKSLAIENIKNLVCTN